MNGIFKARLAILSHMVKHIILAKGKMLKFSPAGGGSCSGAGNLLAGYLGEDARPRRARLGAWRPAVGRFGAGWPCRAMPFESHTGSAQALPSLPPRNKKTAGRRFLLFLGGSGEIRTHEQFNPSLVFKTSAFNHSATLPKCAALYRFRLQPGALSSLFSSSQHYCAISKKVTKPHYNCFLKNILQC